MTLPQKILLVSLVGMSLGLFEFASKTSADQSQRQQLVAAATDGCQKSMISIEDELSCLTFSGQRLS